MHAEAIAIVIVTKHTIDTTAEIVRTFSQHVIVDLSGQDICLSQRYYIVYKFELVNIC
jgi:ribonucleotide monophosphatase NagD (HAD superfamily)